ncbi:MAG: hypothetical protein RXP30_06780 [Thermoplasmata archaeon]
MSETYNQALLELFNEAVNSYNEIVYMTSTIGSWETENTIKELALRVLNMQRNVYFYAEWVVRVYIVASAVAGKKPDKRKTMRLLSAAKKVERLAQKLILTTSIETNGLDSNREQKIAEAFTKQLLSTGNAKTFQNRVHTIFRELTGLSHELLEEATNNLATIGIMPRKRIIQQYEENLLANESELPESIDNNERSKADQ